MIQSPIGIGDFISAPVTPNPANLFACFPAGDCDGVQLVAGRGVNDEKEILFPPKPSQSPNPNQDHPNRDPSPTSRPVSPSLASPSRDPSPKPPPRKPQPPPRKPKPSLRIPSGSARPSDSRSLCYPVGMTRGIAKQNLPVLVFSGLMAASLAGLSLLPPIPQDQSYHLFADCRTVAGIPNFWNVVSNIPSLRSAPRASGDFAIVRQPSSCFWGFS
jgi:hypothetical protein